MSSPHEAFRINLNQNLWGVLLGFAAMGTAEKFALQTLFWMAATLSVIMLISLAFTTYAYTINYWRHKMAEADSGGSKNF